ncbi:MAG: hypothetical protein ABIJ58_00070 [Nanoarchaeota archaeon]
MKREVFVSLSLVVILLLSNFASAYSFVGRAVDDAQISLSGGDKKAVNAIDAREKEINDAIENIKNGNTEEAIKNLERAKEKLEIVREEASSDISEEVKTSTGEMIQKINENKNVNPEVSSYLNEYLAEEQKTQLSADLSEKLFNYCEELSKQDYNLMLQDEKCNSDNAPKWLENKVSDNLNAQEKVSAEKMLEIFTTCISNPQGCDCSEIPIASEKAKCEKGKALSIRCEFQNDETACKELDKMDIIPSKLPGFLKAIFNQKVEDAMNKKEKEMFGQFAPPECIEAGATTREACEAIMMENYAPRECIEAGATTKDECEKIMIGIKGPPSTECMENGEFIGPDLCDEKMVKSGKIPKECIENGKPIPPEDCNKIMQEKGDMGMGPPPECEGISKEECGTIMQEKGMMGPGGQQIMSGECKELGIYDPAECEKTVNLPRPCKDAGLYTTEECEGGLMQQNMPKECIDAGALTPNTCKKIMLPEECKATGASSLGECETNKIVNKMPSECQEKEATSPEACARIMSSKVVIEGTPGSEIDFLTKKGVSSDEIPGVCMSGSNFVRGMDCDKALSAIGVVLPPPKDTSNIPQECMKEGTPISPQECQSVLEKKLVTENIPGPCREAGVTDPKECGTFLDGQRVAQGLGMNIPGECMGIPVEECKNVMKEKNITIKGPGPLNDQEYNGICDEGEETCGTEGVIKKGVPKECAELGVYDKESCSMIMSKINEERMTKGEKMTVDKDGNQDYITPEEVEKIAGDAEKKAEQPEVDLNKAEEYKQEVDYYQEKIQMIEQTGMEQKAGMVEQQTSGPESVSDGGEAQSAGPKPASAPSAPSELSGGGSESASVLTGETVRNIPSGNNFLTSFFNKIFG